ncbi:MAG: hypothetical protein U9R04_04025 [Chloroflexota bacterium]|nr:hypothetical protein [Chloroflexota bacterium]
MARSFEDFCASMLRVYGRPEAIAYDIAVLAQHFVEYFGLSSYPNLLELKLVLDLHHQIVSIQPGCLGGLAACHYLDRSDKLNIEYEGTDWLGRNEFSIVHECYEAIQETFEVMTTGYKAYRDPTNLCMKPYADRFAAAVLMQPEVFIPAVIETGLDVCSLRRYFYNRSYASVAIRIKELFKPPVVDDGIDFLIAIYDRESESEPQDWDFNCNSSDFHAGCVVKTSGIRLSRSKRRVNLKAYLLPRRLFPVRGEKPAPGFIVDEIIQCKKPVYFENAMFDLLGANEMTLLARPVYWYGRLAKVVVIAVRRKDSGLLQKQLEGLSQLDIRPLVYIS